MSILGTIQIITLFQVGKLAHLEFLFEYNRVKARHAFSKTDFRHFPLGRLRHDIFAWIIALFARPEISVFTSLSKIATVSFRFRL
jgi:hypothetical protein